MTNVNVIDLDEFVVGWASQLGKSKGNNSSQNVTHTIDWSRVNVSTEQPSYSSTMTSAPHSVTLFNSRFENKSFGEQEHTFSAQSKYTSSTSVSLRQCFTLDGRTKVDLSLPRQVLDATSAFGQNLKTKTTRILLRDTLFADHSALVAHCAEEMQKIMDAFSDASKGSSA